MAFHPVDAPLHPPAESAGGAPAPASARPAPPRARPAPFSWTVGHPRSEGAGTQPEWLHFLSPGVASGEDWLDFLRR